ncbi:hypothetical protein [Streptomyces sp. UG1]|uniref:hypothetical protein n=1 Tax=Streptomyces sp. UG1 TaxID=3417652 RepID=UPI003CF9F006
MHDVLTESVEVAVVLEPGAGVVDLPFGTTICRSASVCGPGRYPVPPRTLPPAPAGLP